MKFYLVISVLILAIGCSVESPDDSSFPKRFGFKGISGNRIFTTKTALVRTEPMSDSDKADLGELSSILNGFTLLSESKLLIHAKTSEDGITRDTAFECGYTILSDTLSFIGEGSLCNGKIKAHLGTSELKIGTCNYSDTWKYIGHCPIPPPEDWRITQLFGERDTIWVVKGELLYSRQ
jgi:hypothetical protein